MTDPLVGSDASRRRIVLDIDPRSDPISGDLDDGSGRHRFSGWLELADALQAAIGLAPEDTTTE